LKNGSYVNSWLSYNIQIKATYNYSRNGNEIVYALKSEAYERLLVHKGGLIVLVLFCLPKEPTDRITLVKMLGIAELLLWYRLLARIILTLHIPRSQLFDPQSLQGFDDLRKEAGLEK